MAKSADAFRTISEVAEWLETPAHVLRFWESKFTQVKPVKRAGGRRYYRPADMELLGGIKQLLHEEGMTIKGVQKLLRERGVGHVSALSPKRVLEDGEVAPEGLISDEAMPPAHEAEDYGDPAPMQEDAPEELSETPTVVPFRSAQPAPQTAPDPAPASVAPDPAPESPAPDAPLMPTGVEAGADHEGLSEDVAELAAQPDPDLDDGPPETAPRSQFRAETAPEPQFPAEGTASPAPRPRVIDLPPDPEEGDLTPPPGLLARVAGRTAPLDAETAARVGPLLRSLSAWARKGELG